MTVKTYKKIFDALPDGAFVFDDKLRVKFTNVAFRRAFLEGKEGDFSFDGFHRVMQDTVETKEGKTETVRSSIKRGGQTDKISFKIRTFPVDKKGKLFLALIGASYETEIEREMLTAKRMQQRLLPAGKSMGGVPYSYMYIPCYGVGGDLPDVYELEGQTYGVLADVSGKGISAGMLSAFVKAGFDRNEPNLGKALSTLNAKFNELNQDERSYITVASVRIDKEKRMLRYAMAGHNAPILLKDGEGIHEIETPAPPISNWMDGFTYEEKEFPYARGSILALITDGVTECVNGKGELFGIERAESVLMQSRNAEDFIGKLRSALSVFSGGKFSDDITAIAFDL